MTVANVHGGPQRREGEHGVGRGAIILCHDGIFEFGATTTFSETIETTTFSEIATTTMFLKWLPRQRNIVGHDVSTED